MNVVLCACTCMHLSVSHVFTYNVCLCMYVCTYNVCISVHVFVLSRSTS